MIKYAAIFASILFITGCGKDYPKATIHTSMGDIVMEIYDDQAPVTAGNFMKLVQDHVYTDACFYRIVNPDNQPGNPVRIEVIQGGLFHDSLIRNFSPIVHETTEKTGILHRDGVISMARLEPGTASTEFFICVGDQPSLDYGGKRNPDEQGFAAFGKVVQGMEVVQRIHQLPAPGQYLDDPVRIDSITLSDYLE